MSLPNTLNLQLPFGITLPEVNSLSIEFNGHMPSYMSIEQYYEASLSNRDAWVSEESRTKAIETNQVWCFHWYNKTPVGSWTVLAHSLEAGLQGLARITKEEYAQ